MQKSTLSSAHLLTTLLATLQDKSTLPPKGIPSFGPLRRSRTSNTQVRQAQRAAKRRRNLRARSKK
jgi:hypothetical protein